MKEVVMPALGVAMEEGVLVRWAVKPGDEVGRGDVLADIETDKAVVELESAAAGRVGTFSVAAGATVPVGTLLVVIEEPGDVSSEPA